jgi:hypothetical protein
LISEVFDEYGIFQSPLEQPLRVAKRKINARMNHDHPEARCVYPRVQAR